MSCIRDPRTLVKGQTYYIYGIDSGRNTKTGKVGQPICGTFKYDSLYGRVSNHSGISGVNISGYYNLEQHWIKFKAIDLIIFKTIEEFMEALINDSEFHSYLSQNLSSDEINNMLNFLDVQVTTDTKDNSESNEFWRKAAEECFNAKEHYNNTLKGITGIKYINPFVRLSSE